MRYNRAMDARALRRYRDRLAALEGELAGAGFADIEPARQDPTAVGTDDDAQPLVEMSQAIASGRNRNRADVLAKIAAARARMDEDPDAFGLCAECGEPISAKRLELMPYVELCVECQGAKDGPRQPTGRKHLRDFR